MRVCIRVKRKILLGHPKHCLFSWILNVSVLLTAISGYLRLDSTLGFSNVPNSIRDDLEIPFSCDIAHVSSLNRVWPNMKLSFDNPASNVAFLFCRSCFCGCFCAGRKTKTIYSFGFMTHSGNAFRSMCDYFYLFAAIIPCLIYCHSHPLVTGARIISPSLCGHDRR